MSAKEVHARIKANVWQAIAQSDLDFSVVPQDKLTAIVDLVTESALLEMDQQLTTTLSNQVEDELTAKLNDDNEDILWEGRPFLSISKRYVITDDRIRIIDGLFGRKFLDIELVRVQDVQQSQTLSERMLNIGDVTIFSHDKSDPEFTLENVTNPQEVHEILRRAVLAARKKHNFSYRQEM
jgi:hypothetical protein